MGAMGAILCTTKNNAELMGMEKKIGSVEAGKYADLLVVRKDPLKDVRIFQDRDNLAVIMQGGQFIKNTL